MNVTSRLVVRSVRYDDQDNLEVLLVTELVDDQGNVVGTGETHRVELKQSDAEKLAEAKGGQWGDEEVEALVKSTKVVDEPAKPATLHVYEVRDDAGNLVFAEIPGIPAKEATYKDRFSQEAQILHKPPKKAS